MSNKIQLFIESPITGGYSIAVRDDWTFKIKRVSISESEKEKYEKDYGNKILTYKEFFEWWTEINSINREVDEYERF